MEKIKDNKISYYAIIIAFLFLSFISSVYIGNTLLWFVKIPTNGISFIIFPIITIIISKFVLNKDRERISWKFLIITLLIYFVIIVVLALVNNAIWDNSYDSLWYHQEAVIQQYYGWNPIYNSGKTMNIWVSHYPKAPATFAASLYKLTGRIESAKILTTLLPLILFVLSFGVFNLITKNKRKVLSFFAAIIIILNPIIISQALTFYVDSTMSIYIIILLINLYLILMYKDMTLFKYFTLIGVATFLINVKFTGLAYAGVILLGFFILSCIYNKKDYNLKLITFLILGFIFSVVIIGFNPYVTNTINNGNLLYPIMGKGKIDIMTHNTPEGFKNDGRFVQAYKSLIAIPEPSYKGQGAPAKTMKEMFGISKSRLTYYANTDCRLRGFGIYSVIFLPVSFILLLYLLGTARRGKKLFVSIFGLIIVLGTLVGLGSFWWVRYIAFIWTLPIIIGLLMILRKSKISKTIGVLLLLLMAFNSVIILPFNLKYKIDGSRHLKSYIFDSGQPLKIEDNVFADSYVNKAKEFHIKYILEQSENNEMS